MSSEEVLIKLQKLVFELDRFKYIEYISYDLIASNKLQIVIKFQSNSYKYCNEDLIEIISNTLSFIKVVGNYDIKLDYFY